MRENVIICNSRERKYNIVLNVSKGWLLSCYNIFDLLFMYNYVMFYLFVWGFSSYSRTFHSYGGVTITDEGLQILSYARQLRPLSRGYSLACHIYCDPRRPFIMVISKDPWHSHILPSVWQWNSLSLCLHDLGLSRLCYVLFFICIIIFIKKFRIGLYSIVKYEDIIIEMIIDEQNSINNSWLFISKKKEIKIS